MWWEAPVKGVFPTNGVVYPSKAYVDPPTAGYTASSGSSGVGYALTNFSNQIVWKFKPALGNSFLSTHISGVQRFPNGNTMACAGEMGHFIEVASDGTIVWEYSNPIGTGGVAYRYEVNQDTGGGLGLSVFRAYRFSPVYPGLVNHVRVLPTGQILPIVLGETGVGYTLTGAAPCINVPCNSGTSVGGF